MERTGWLPKSASKVRSDHPDSQLLSLQRALGGPKGRPLETAVLLEAFPGTVPGTIAFADTFPGTVQGPFQGPLSLLGLFQGPFKHYVGFYLSEPHMYFERSLEKSQQRQRSLERSLNGPWKSASKNSGPWNGPWKSLSNYDVPRRLHVCLLACLFACLPACLLVCLSVCLPACLSVCLSVCLPVVRGGGETESRARRVWFSFGFARSGLEIARAAEFVRRDGEHASGPIGASDAHGSRGRLSHKNALGRSLYVCVLRVESPGRLAHAAQAHSPQPKSEPQPGLVQQFEALIGWRAAGHLTESELDVAKRDRSGLKVRRGKL